MDSLGGIDDQFGQRRDAGEGVEEGVHGGGEDIERSVAVDIATVGEGEDYGGGRLGCGQGLLVVIGVGWRAWRRRLEHIFFVADERVAKGKGR